MQWDIEALRRELQATNPRGDTSFLQNQLIDLVRQCNALREFFEAEHDHRWSVGAEVEPTFQTLQAARKEVMRVCKFGRAVREPRQT